MSLGLLRLGGAYYTQGTEKERNNVRREANPLFAKAVWVYEQIITRLVPSETTLAAEYFCGNSYIKLGQYEEAISVFDELLAHTSDLKYTAPVRLKIRYCQDELTQTNE